MSYSERLIRDARQYCEGLGYPVAYTTEQSNPGPSHYLTVTLH
jgi:hypothetical protein